jgi:hypothetical protein
VPLALPQSNDVFALAAVTAYEDVLTDAIIDVATPPTVVAVCAHLLRGKKNAMITIRRRGFSVTSN